MSSAPPASDASLFARRVLFATSLEDKLDPPRPGELAAHPPTRTDPALARARLLLPGRPADLAFKGRDEKSAPLPAEAHLIDDPARARLLHFFCNHELLAVELMALALLKFDDAPAAFRNEVLSTLLEEQQHTRWYLDRLSELDHHFGSQPLSRMIWDAIAPMTCPLDYVSRLSLTFEQANLDYALHYHHLFKQAGDPESAAILGRIYRDEIGHVRTGVSWLRAFKEPGEDDFGAWSRNLARPLAPVRARGNVPLFNAEGRRRAGLDEEFIEHVRLATGSRGRRPDLWSFDPLAELRWAGVDIPASLQPLAAALEGVLFCFARPEDLVVLRQPPSDALRRRWAAAGLPLPRAVDPDDVDRHESARRHHHRWAPDPRHDPPAWRPLFDKETPAHWLTEIRASLGLPEAPELELDRFETAAPLDARVRDHFNASAAPLVLKAPFGAAGHGVRRLASPADLDRHRRWILRLLAQQGRLLLGPWLAVEHEGSAHYDFDTEGRLRFRGLVWTECSPGGRFQSALALANPTRHSALNTGLRRFLADRGGAEPAPLAWWREHLPAALAPRLAALGFRGTLGIDFLLHRRDNGSPGFHPFNDLNPRRSFGRAALELRRRLGSPDWLRLSIGAMPPDAAGCHRLPLGEGGEENRQMWASWAQRERRAPAKTASPSAPDPD